MAILSPLHLEGWEIGRAPPLPVSRTFWIISHTLPSTPSPLPPLPNPFPSSSSPPFYFFLSARGSLPPCAHVRQAWQQSKYRT
jgi:hypothetical protein